MQHRRTLFVLALTQALTLTAHAACTVQRGFDDCATLSPQYLLNWRIRGKDITFKAIVNATDVGWVGLGISEGGGMRGTDMAIAKKNLSTGAWTLGDYFSEDYVPPKKDVHQDVELLEASQKGAVVSITFKRKLKTCDVEQDWPIELQLPQYVVWAYADIWGYHGPNNRGTEMIYLNKESEVGTVLAADSSTSGANLQYLDLRIANNTIPPVKTTYKCQYFDLPADKKYHVYNYEGVVSSKLVHHMILYICDKKALQLSKVFECARMPPGCNSFMLGWAPGGSKLGSPAEAALPMGKTTGVMYAALQIHYNNPAGIVGQEDKSGFRVGYSSKLKKYDMGVLTLGQLSLNLPPGKHRYTAQPGVCSAACTSRFPHPLTMVNTGFHMHTLGRSAITRHIRGDQELEPVGVRKYFDFNFQHYMPIIKNDTRLLPGDALVTTCSYDTTSRTTVTKYGETTDDEMCLNFVQYYPRVPDVDLCLNSLIWPYTLCAPATLDLYNFTVIAQGLRKGQIMYATSNYTNVKPFQRPRHC